MNIVVAGGGRFGSRAVIKLKDTAEKITVVDINPNCHASKMSGIDFVVRDAPRYIAELMVNNIVPDYIVPCIPGNLVARIFIEYLSLLGFRIAVDEEGFINALSKIGKDIIIIADKSSATIVASHAKGFLCPTNCRPLEVCPISNKAIRPLYSILDFGVKGRIFISRILVNGVGGISGREIYEELSLRSKMRPGSPLYIGTACECHGIVSFMRIT